jgi:phosphate/sulfate permease
MKAGLSAIVWSRLGVTAAAIVLSPLLGFFLALLLVSARKVAAVRWNVATNVVFAWIVTLPATALFGAAFYELGALLF